MCGIVGYIGRENAKDIVTEGLETLEYRGYDSAGVALGAEKLRIFKTAGRVNRLKAMLPGGVYHSAIGHTRWATHGGPNAVNAHPHLSYDGKVAVVHNGVLENFGELKKELAERGINCVSETDSELIAHLLAPESGDMLEAVRRVGGRLKGAATFLAMREGDDAIYAYRQGASMLTASGAGGSFAASDGLALARYVSEAIVLDDGEYAKLTQDGVAVFKDGRAIFKRPIALKQSPPKKCDCHMRAEIEEIPAALMRTFFSASRALDGEFAMRMRRADRIVLAGCGTAFHACRYGKALIEAKLHRQAEAIAASEMDSAELVGAGTLAIFITQSGETADTLLALKKCAQKGAYTLAITNVIGSSAALSARKTLYLDAGAEIAVAATKSFDCQLLALFMAVRAAMGEPMREEEARELAANAERCVALGGLFDERALGQKLFFVGRGQDLVTAKEGALKLKEITYRQAEAYAAGELKHGPIALIDAQSAVIVIATRDEYLPRISATVSELRSRGAYTVGLSCVGELGTDSIIELPRMRCVDLEPLVAVIPLQNLALEAALRLGLDPDKPRNLAKSVTVI